MPDRATCALVTEASRPCVELSALAAAVDAVGCTDDEVAQVSADQGRTLPGTYRCFLKVMGRDVGGLFGGALASYPHILGLRAAAIDLLRDNGERNADVFALPDDAIVISFHDQGYAFQFIRASLGDDAPVEMWTEGPAMDRTEVVAASVLDWVRNAFDYETAPEREADRRHLQGLLRRDWDASL